MVPLRSGPNTYARYSAGVSIGIHVKQIGPRSVKYVSDEWGRGGTIIIHNPSMDMSSKRSTTCMPICAVALRYPFEPT